MADLDESLFQPGELAMTDPNAFDRVSPVEDSNWQASWETEENYWQENFSSRPYSLGPDYYDRFRPAYRYGFESAQHHLGRTWEDAEPDLRQGWQSYEHRGQTQSTWDEIKEAVRDAWNRITGTQDTRSDQSRPEIRE
jgi:hypothetical protein